MARLQTCPKCRALLETGTKRCPYCETDTRHVGAPTELQAARHTFRLASTILWANAILFLLVVLLDPAREESDGLFVEPSREAHMIFGWAHRGLVHECGQYWRLVASLFLHADLMHLLFNCVAIVIITPLAAMTLGSSRTACLYLLAGLAGAILSHAAGNSGLGASGAVCGLIGALGVYGQRRGGSDGEMLARRMLVWGLIILVFGYVMPNIDNYGHAGGLLAGAVAGWYAAAVSARGGGADRTWQKAAVVGWGLVILVGVLFWLPAVWRGLDRREVELFRNDTRRSMQSIGAVNSGREQLKTLPRKIDDGPGDTDALRAALSTALDAARRRSPDAAEALRRARDEWRRWEATLFCRYCIEGRG